MADGGVLTTELYLLAVLCALLLGLAVGKAWERYKLRDGRWIDRRRLRETPHYMLGLNFLVDNQVDQAIDELTQATSFDTDALEIQMILGNLYRQKGQVGRAINIHQGLLQRPDLTKLEQAYVLLCLGLDFRHGGFVDRAFEAFQEVLRLDPRNRYALVNLQKLYEDQHQWADALRVREQVIKIDAGRRPDDQQILGFLRNEMGLEQQRAGNSPAALRSFDDAIDLDGRTVPAYLNLGDAHERAGNLPDAVEAWERLVKAVPEHAHFAFERLERAYGRMGASHRFEELCHRLIDRDPQSWRARLALSRHLAAAGKHRAAFDRAARRASSSSARSRDSSGNLGGTRCARVRPHPDTPLRRTHSRSCLLPRPAHLPPLSLSQHRTALAVPAMPRVEHFRRGTARARQGRVGRGGSSGCEEVVGG